jgi:hypothetical protein
VIARQLLKTFAPPTALFIIFGQQLYHRLFEGADKLAQAPKVMLWAWERPEQLSFLDASNTGVAYLAETIYPAKDGFTVRPRLQPLHLPEAAYLEAVVRIETDRRKNWALSQEQLDALVREVIKASSLPGVKALQIDFDARENERSFYRQLLTKIRKSLPERMPLSMTALSSWCMGDQWLRDIPVDEVVPMLFSMGAGRRESIDFLTNGDSGRFSYFQKCLGISINDPQPADILAKRTKLNGTRIYLFSPRSWNSVSLNNALDEVHIWQRPSVNL